MVKETGPLNAGLKALAGLGGAHLGLKFNKYSGLRLNGPGGVKLVCTECAAWLPRGCGLVAACLSGVYRVYMAWLPHGCRMVVAMLWLCCGLVAAWMGGMGRGEIMKDEG
jgi:hypothetical protein